MYSDLADAIRAFEAGDAASCEAICRRSIEAAPYLPYFWQVLQKLYMTRGDDAALAAVDERLSAVMPIYGDVEFRRATARLRAGNLDAARRGFDRALNLPLSFTPTRMLPHGTASKARLLHDAAYIRFAEDRGLLDVSCLKPCLERLDALAAEMGEDDLRELSAEELVDLGPVYRRCLHLQEVAIPERIVDEDVLLDAVERFARTDQEARFVYFDGLFTPDGLEALRTYLLYSTIWHNDAQKGRGYLGAYATSGLMHPLVTRISATVERVLARVLDGAGLRQIWCYRNLGRSAGVGVHADFSAINLNVWLTPEAFNLQPDSGGLVFYEKRAPADWSFERFNGDDEGIAATIADAPRTRVPYRMNRAMIFDSALFHGSDRVLFENCFEGWRINMTMLFGERPQG